MRIRFQDSLIGPRLQSEPAWLRYGLAVGLLVCTAYTRAELIPLIDRHTPSKERYVGPIDPRTNISASA